MVHARGDGHSGTRDCCRVPHPLHLHNEDPQDQHLQHPQPSPVRRLQPRDLPLAPEVGDPPVPLPLP